MVKINKTKFQDASAKYLFILCACMSIVAVFGIIGYILYDSLPALREIGVFKFLFGTEWNPDREVFGIFPMILGSIYVTAGAVLLGVPVALLCAIFMARYCPPRLYKIFKPVIELKDGVLVKLGIARGQKKSRQYLYREYEAVPVDKDWPVYTGYTYDSAAGESFFRETKERYQLEGCRMYPVGGVIGTHVGKNCLALAFVRERNN